MNRSTTHVPLFLAALSAVIAFALLSPAPALAHGPVSGGASNDSFNDLFRIMLWIATPIFLLVEGLLLFAIIRYRRRRHDEMPEQVHGSTPLELTWTVLALAIIAVVFVLGYRVMQQERLVEAGDETEFTPDLTVHVTGYMFNWDYEYFLGEGEETGVMTTRELTIPAQRNVLLEIASSDVQHSFWVPKLAGKVDAIPGYVNTLLLNVKEPGRYVGQCAEYCGLNHYAMMIEVNAVEPAEFDAWLTEKMAAQGEFHPVGTDLSVELPEGDLDRGREVFSALGCDACHTANTDQPSGPSIQRMAADANSATEAAGHDDRVPFLHESIVQPCAYLADGWSQCIMPQDYGERMDAQNLADVIAYILSYGEEQGPGGGPQDLTQADEAAEVAAATH